MKTTHFYTNTLSPLAVKSPVERSAESAFLEPLMTTQSAPLVLPLELNTPMPLKRIGGFFELELPTKGSLYHDSAIALANGRVCFKVLLQKVKPTKVYVPFYTCERLLQPLRELGIRYQFYAIDAHFEPLSMPTVRNTELFVYINYFGLKRAFAKKLSAELGENLVIDNTQAFFEGAFGKTWAFNSVRKFLGVPDGGFLYAPSYVYDNYLPNQKIVSDHLWLELSGRPAEAVSFYRESEAQQTTETSGMSDITKRILYGVNFLNVARLRKRHFKILNNALQNLNALPTSLLEINTAVPFCYPLLLKKTIDKSIFEEKRIVVESLWQDVLDRNTEGYVFEKNVAENLIPLPIDHRMNDTDLRRVVDTVQELTN
jgi:hypothetical protein